MMTRRKARSAAALEELYHDRDNDNAATDHASDTDDADNIESGCSHASETDIEEENVAMKRMEFIFELSLQLVKPLLVRRLATPTLRVGLCHSIEEFLNAGDVPEDLNISLEFANNKMSKQKRCNLCPTSLDRKTFYKCLRCDKPMCREHVAKVCCECV